MEHVDRYLSEVAAIAERLDRARIRALVDELVALRQRGGRLFLIGVGGSAANASHAVNDFRKLCGIEAYSPADNVSELTARTNDEGWGTVFAAWLETSRLDKDDALLVFSVGGGDSTRGISVNIVNAVDLALERGARVLGVVGRESGHTAQRGDVVVVVPAQNPAWLTPLSEAFQGVVWHCLVSHPALQIQKTKW